MARAKKPQSLKLIAGTNRADRPDPDFLELPNVSEIPEPPSWLPNPWAVEYYWKIAKSLHVNGLLTDLGTGPLQIHCALFGNIVQMEAAGITPPGTLVAQFRATGNDFGLTPASMGKVTLCYDPGAPKGFQKNRRPKS